MKMGQVKPHGKSYHGSYTPEKFQSNGSPGGNGERQEQISRARGGKDPRGAARMLSGTSYLLSPHYWALSRVPANTETFPVSGLGGIGQGELFMLAVPKQLGAGSGPQESEPCCCSSSLLTHGTTTTCPHQWERQTAVCLHAQLEGCLSAVGVRAPARGGPGCGVSDG